MIYRKIAYSGFERVSQGSLNFSGRDLGWTRRLNRGLNKATALKLNHERVEGKGRAADGGHVGTLTLADGGQVPYGITSIRGVAWCLGPMILQIVNLKTVL